jgi:hypothetical protein
VVNLIGIALKTGTEIYKNKSATKIAMSEAQLLHVEKMKRGEIEFSGKISENQKSDWKDEFVLITISSPLFLLAYSVFAEDEKMQQKMDMYFQNYKKCLGGLLAYGFPWWLPFTDLKQQT